MRNKLILAAVAAIAIPASASAGDSNWTGFYGGVGLGYSDISDGTDSDSGFAYGGFVGYDYDLGSFVLGGEFEYVRGDFDVSGIDFDADTFRFKARAGVGFDRTLVYGVAGYSNIDADGGGGSTNFDAFTLGAGIAFKVTDNVELGAEYLHDFADGPVNFDSITARLSYRF